MVRVGKPERILCGVGLGDGHIADSAGETHAAGDVLHELLPLRPRRAYESLALDEFHFSSRFKARLAIKSALLVYGCVHLKILHGWEDGISRNFEQTRLTYVWNNQSQFVPNLSNEKSERSDFRSCVEIKKGI